MDFLSVTSLSDEDLRRQLEASAVRMRENLAKRLALIAQMDAQQAHLEHGHASLLDFCVQELGMDGDEIEAEIPVARLAHRYPAMLPAIEQGRLNTDTAALLAPVLEEGNVDALIAWASGRVSHELERMLLERFGIRPALVAVIRPGDPGRHLVAIDMDDAMHSILRRAQQAFHPSAPSTDVSEVFKVALRNTRWVV